MKKFLASIALWYALVFGIAGCGFLQKLAKSDHTDDLALCVMHLPDDVKPVEAIAKCGPDAAQVVLDLLSMKKAAKASGWALDAGADARADVAHDAPVDAALDVDAQ